MSKFALYETVKLKRDIDEPAIAKGTTGVIVEMLPPDGLAVEFFDDTGETIDVALLPESFVALVKTQTAKKAPASRASADS